MLLPLLTLLAGGPVRPPFVPASPSAPSILSGVVRYADGRPAANCRVVVLHPAFDPMQETRCDGTGRYRLELAPDTYNAVAILDEGYGRTTLERALAKEPPAREVVAGDTLLVEDIAPALTAGSVRVTIDGAPAEVESLQWYYERFVDRESREPRHLRVALLQLRRPTLIQGTHLVRVRIVDARTGALGEGTIGFESNAAGLGF